MPTLRKLPQCINCRYHDLSGHLVCALYPSGPVGDRCADFDAIVEVAAEGHWVPEGWAFERGELLPRPSAH
ncbi:hypothetical protein [Acaryochloris thomasi]|uniref:hypothetical protein n=1 Tax=Acaryochloris thomasi TaxID=2929456 RepID=UPI000DA67C3A|nr:hypothetical protein [Acaryochloris thomasi]